jgi:Uma2 family endonuclease
MVADPARRNLTLDDYLALPDDADYEVIRGRLYVAPRPFARHQDVEWDLAATVIAHVERTGGTRRQVIVDADLLMPHRHSYVSPDLMYFDPDVTARIDRGRRIDVREFRPALVVEVVSRSTVRRDLTEKTAEYAAVGIPHCWVLGPTPRRFREYVLNEETGKYDLAADRVGGRVTPRLFASDDPPLMLDLNALGQ